MKNSKARRSHSSQSKAPIRWGRNGSWFWEYQIARTRLPVRYYGCTRGVTVGVPAGVLVGVAVGVRVAVAVCVGDGEGVIVGEGVGEGISVGDGEGVIVAVGGTIIMRARSPRVVKIAGLIAQMMPSPSTSARMIALTGAIQRGSWRIGMLPPSARGGVVGEV